MEYINEFNRMKSELENKNRVPVSFREALLLAAEQQEKIEKLEIEKKLNEPKVYFAETIEKSNDCILVRDFCKILGNNEIKFGQQKFYSWLREKKYIEKNSTMPTQRAINMGLFTVLERSIITPKGNKISKTSKITGKGQVYFLKKLSL